MPQQFDDIFASLTPIQRNAVEWQDGAALILAGPGAGKTRVLTTRIARLLNAAPKDRFKVLALTFTTKAAAEMRERIEVLVPEGVAEGRTFIGTFHAFCTQILRQHGSHIGIKPDFGIYNLTGDRQALLVDAIQAAIKRGELFSESDVSWLEAIDAMRSKLVTPEKVGNRIRDPQMAKVYKLYEEKLKSDNLMDFNGLILETCRLLAKLPAIAARVRSSYRYWMIDEFQDTTPAQYWLLHYLSGGEFKNVFAVADDDQIIYQWAGASYRQIEKFRNDYRPRLIQLVENHRCPPEIVELANRLVANNTQRAPEKLPTVAARTLPKQAVSIREFVRDVEEQDALATEIAKVDKQQWGNIVVLARIRALLAPLLTSLKEKGVNAVILQRRDNFISPQFVWLQALLDQAVRPSYKRVFTVLVDAANRITGMEIDPLILIAEAEAAGHSFFEHWGNFMKASNSPLGSKLGNLAISLAQTRSDWKKIVQAAIPILLENAKVGDGSVSDATDDHFAWTACLKEIRLEAGQEPGLSELVQGLALRSKEPPRDPHSVALLTIHTAKGLEFDTVYVIGLSEREMPSWQSLQKGDTSPEMEEERRNCFVAITRTREKLVLSFARQYRGYSREPSRFLKEMNLI